MARQDDAVRPKSVFHNVTASRCAPVALCFTCHGVTFVSGTPLKIGCLNMSCANNATISKDLPNRGKVAEKRGKIDTKFHIQTFITISSS